MKDNEALKYLKEANRKNDMLCVLPNSDIGKCLINALEEIQQYRDRYRGKDKGRTGPIKK